MVMKFTNNATSTLASGITSSATSLTVATGNGALFPTLGGSDYFYCTLANTSGTVEIVKVTARTTDTFTVTRGQDGTSGVAWNSGDKVELRLVAASLNDIPKLDEANTFTAANAYGTPASIVLTNATSVPVNQATGTLAYGNGGTGLTSPGASGNVLTSNGTSWTSSSNVSSIVAGTNITISGATGAVTINASSSVPSAGAVGSYAFVGNLTTTTALSWNTNYAVGTGSSQVQTFARYNDNTGGNNNSMTTGSDLSGTWKWLAASTPSGYYPMGGVAIRVS